jgi:hypothetical protein
LSERSHSAAFVWVGQQPPRACRSSLRASALVRIAAFAVPTLVALASSPMILRSEPPSVLRLSEYQKCEWQIEDGLPENNVRMISQRPDGALLLATAAGIASFDGQHFRTLSIGNPGNTPLMSDNEAVNAILPVSNDDLWIGTDGSGVIHQTRSGSVNISEQAGRFNERVRAFYKDNTGVIWIATQNGVERYVNGHLEVITGTEMISGDITTPFAEDGHGGMFYVTSAGLFHWRNGIAQPYRLQSSRSHGTEAMTGHRLLFLSPAVVWARPGDGPFESFSESIHVDEVSFPEFVGWLALFIRT